MLAFEADEHSKAVGLGIIAGSLLSAVVGYLILRFTVPGRVKTSWDLARRALQLYCL